MSRMAAHHDGQRLTRLEELAQREAVSANFLVQILNDLRRAGLIESRRGKSGGYLLARSPAAIRLRQIVEAIEPALLRCTVAAEGESGLAVRQTWANLSQCFSSQLDEVTLEQMMGRIADPMFHI
jgi:Rrf2 family protein